ncbi:MAG: hypothetical protein H8E55_20010 [Pelagibacterales bacterium]|nr:hypothetical protein [Pelagibacterales bacterium]
MALFHEKLLDVKKNKDTVISINFESNIIILKVVNDSKDTVELLYLLREKYREMFATDFVMTKEKTKRWINELILDNPDRILFTISINSKIVGCIGHGGLDANENSSQLDNMMKDPSCKIPGMMTVVEKVYLRWMFEFFKLSKITGYLFSDNERMMNIHYECGWRLLDKVPINKKMVNEYSVWQMSKESDNDNVERYFNIIELKKEDLLKNFEKIEYEIHI